MALYPFLIILSYLIGSISTAIVVCRAMGYPDPRRYGSGNPGATNVFRLYGKTAAALTLAGDLLKGLLPILLGKALRAPEPILAGMGIAAFLGHLYPLFFRFQGGKGIATFIGVLYGLAWPAGMAYMGIWLLVAWLSRYVSVAGLVAAVLSPIVVFIITRSYAYLFAAFFMAILIFWRHRANIHRLMVGTERKIGSS